MSFIILTRTRIKKQRDLKHIPISLTAAINTIHLKLNLLQVNYFQIRGIGTAM